MIPDTTYQALFIPRGSVGEIVYATCVPIEDSAKRARESCFRKARNMLLALRVLPITSEIIAIGTSLRADGTSGIVVLCANRQVAGVVPTGDKETMI